MDALPDTCPIHRYPSLPAAQTPKSVILAALLLGLDLNMRCAPTRTPRPPHPAWDSPVHVQAGRRPAAHTHAPLHVLTPVRRPLADVETLAHLARDLGHGGGGDGAAVVSLAVVG